MDPRRSTIAFSVVMMPVLHGPVPGIVPIIDGTSLIEMTRTYEREHGIFVGGYGGIDPRDNDASPVESYGLEPPPGIDPDEEPEKVRLLGCDCGILDDQPLLATAVLDADAVIWRDFVNPFRDETYDEFGPFAFDRAEYDRALVRLAQDLDAAPPPPGP
jgi:hypothetical protein